MTNPYSKAGLVALLMAALLSGCKEKEETPANGADAGGAAVEAQPVRERPRKDEPSVQETQPEHEAKKKSIIGKLFSAADSGTPAYGWDGHVSTNTFNISPDAAYNRTLDAMKNMGFVVDDKESRRDQWRVVATNAQKMQAAISMVPLTGGTAVKVKVGVLGDRTGGERILDEINQSLKRIPVRRVKVVEPEPSIAK